MRAFLLLFVLGIASCSRHVEIESHLDRLDEPVIGIVTITSPKKLREKDPSILGMIPSSYKKWIEQTGVRPIVIPHFLSKEKIKRLISQVNGILFIGGGPSLTRENGEPTGLMRKLEFIYKEGILQNELTGGNFPIWGTCLGFQAIMFAASDYKAKLSRVNTINEMKNLHIIPENYENSKFSEYVGPKASKFLENDVNTFFNNHFAFEVEQFKMEPTLNNEFKIIASYIKGGKEYVAIAEHRKYPILGVQFHPEKILYEHKQMLRISLTIRSSIVSQDMSRILFANSLKNKNHFHSQRELNHYLFHNFFSIKTAGIFETVYYFNTQYFDSDEDGQITDQTKHAGATKTLII